MEKLVCENLNAQIGERVLLDNINFSIKKGKVFMLVGESGSGKSLITKAILGGVPSKIRLTGKLHYDGIDLLTLKAGKWKALRGKQIAYITQNPMAVFNPMQTILSHGYEFFKSNLGYGKAETKSALIQSFTQFKLKNPEKLLKLHPFQLSGGMLQRIMLAMVCETSPGLLIADEPTSALDKYNRDNVIEELLQIKARGISILGVTHDYKLVESLADDVFIMKNGHMVEKGSAADLLENPSTDYGKQLLRPRVFEEN